MANLSLFHPSIKILSSKFPANTLYDKDDIEQELWLKIIVSMPKFKTLSDDEVIKIGYVILNNRVKDIIRLCKRRPDKAGINNSVIEELLHDSFSSIFNYKPIHTKHPDEISQYRQLINDITGWAEIRCDTTKLVIREIIEPSSLTLKNWNNLCSSNKMYNQYDHIPPLSFDRIIGVSKSKVRSIIVDLRDYLIAMDYRSEMSA
jgi:hypothetical protein